jgi:RHS repeat-associated protein
MTNAAGTSVWSAVWLPWGGAHTITGAETNDARFPGQWFQLEAGLHYNWHRAYDPSLGRYTQPDPLGFVDGPSVYAYARNVPIFLTDFKGLDSSDYPSLPPPLPDNGPDEPNPCEFDFKERCFSRQYWVCIAEVTQIPVGICGCVGMFGGVKAGALCLAALGSGTHGFCRWRSIRDCEDQYENRTCTPSSFGK